MGKKPNDGKFKVGNKAGNKLKPGNQWRYQPGQSGSPGGLSQRRRAFEAAFYGALMGEGTPDEAARLLWEAARAKEAWAIQLLLQRIAPQDTKVSLEVSRGEDTGFDLTKLSDAEIEALERILEHCKPAVEIEGGEVPEGPPDVQ
jgi:hypothetical protein